jgi:hypothetical protein
MLRSALVLVAVVTAAGKVAAAEQMSVVRQDAFLCVNWAAWHEFGLASLTPDGARMSKLCPRRLAAGTTVLVIDEDAGEGSSRIRYRGTEWFVDSQRLR